MMLIIMMMRLFLPLRLGLTLLLMMTVVLCWAELSCWWWWWLADDNLTWECCWLENGILGRVKAAFQSVRSPVCTWCLFFLDCHKRKTPPSFRPSMYEYDENWRIKSTPSSTKVSQRMTAFFFSFLFESEMSSFLFIQATICTSIQQQHHITPVCMSRTAFSIYCDASWISCGRPKNSIALFRFLFLFPGLDKVWNLKAYKKVQ